MEMTRRLTVTQEGQGTTVVSTGQVSGNFSLSLRNLRKDFRPGKVDKKPRLDLSRQWRGRMEEEWAKDR